MDCLLLSAGASHKLMARLLKMGAGKALLLRKEGFGMNSRQAKKIDFPDLLSRLGFQPVKVTKGGRELWYRSPFRKELEPSFHTSFLGGKWIWKDFGDTGGNVIDFVMRYQGIQFKEALTFLRNVYQGSLFETSNGVGHSYGQSASQSPFQKQDQQKQRELEFVEAHEIQNPTILAYLEEQRKIPAILARMYLKEVKYRNILKDKVFFALGMENESGGYEIRAASDKYKFKSALIKRDISIIQGSDPDRNSVSVFEGITDYLSLLVLQKTERLDQDVVIMHSISTFKRTVRYIEEQGYEWIFTFLDNDATGEKYSARFKDAFSRGHVQSQNQSFRPYKDLNEALIARNPINPDDLIFQYS